MREKSKVDVPIGYWRVKLRRLIKNYQYGQSSLARRASRPGQTILVGNLSGFTNNSRPDGGDALSVDKLDQVARALGYRLDVVPDDSIVVRHEQLERVIEAAAKKVIKRITKEAERDS